MSLHDGAVLVGVMSGTSLDGVTAAIARFHTGERDAVELLGVETIAYSDGLRERLAAAMQRAAAAEYLGLAGVLATHFAEAVTAVVASAGIARADIAAVAVHGQTIWHAPREGSWQLVDAARVAERTGLAVISDFRARDIAAGGEGVAMRRGN